MEKYSRGRRGAPAKGVGWETAARVQIPPSPPKSRCNLQWLFYISYILTPFYGNFERRNSRSFFWPATGKGAIGKHEDSSGNRLRYSLRRKRPLFALFYVCLIPHKGIHISLLVVGKLSIRCSADHIRQCSSLLFLDKEPL